MHALAGGRIWTSPAEVEPATTNVRDTSWPHHSYEAHGHWLGPSLAGQNRTPNHRNNQGSLTFRQLGSGLCKTAVDFINNWASACGNLLEDGAPAAAAGNVGNLHGVYNKAYTYIAIDIYIYIYLRVRRWRRVNETHAHARRHRRERHTHTCVCVGSRYTCRYIDVHITLDTLRAR